MRCNSEQGERRACEHHREFIPPSHTGNHSKQFTQTILALCSCGAWIDTLGILIVFLIFLLLQVPGLVCLHFMSICTVAEIPFDLVISLNLYVHLITTSITVLKDNQLSATRMQATSSLARLRPGFSLALPMA